MQSLTAFVVFAVLVELFFDADLLQFLVAVAICRTPFVDFAKTFRFAREGVRDLLCNGSITVTKFYIHDNVLFFLCGGGERNFETSEETAPGERLNFLQGGAAIAKPLTNS